jgi:transposase
MVITIAMESTGSYWRGLFKHLQDEGFEVILVNGKHTRNVKGRKTDVIDCQWIQRLHSLGLLSGSFLPDGFTEALRQYVRQREHLVEQSATYIKKMQQSLRQMNIRLDVAIRDIVGESGRAIVEAILQGQRDPFSLASLVNYRVKKSKQEIALSLQGNWKEEYLFELQMSRDLYLTFQNKIAVCDKEIEKILLQRVKEHHFLQQCNTTIKKDQEIKFVKKKKNKNAPQINLQHICLQLTNGINLYAIEGVSDATVLTLISETGFNLNKFITAKNFCSWMALAPNNKITGGKMISSHVSHHNNRLAQALRRAANVIGNMKKGALSQFFRRIAFKYGRMAAITATARKLGMIIWNMLTKRETYRYEETTIYTERLRKLQIKQLQKKITILNIQSHELKFAMS